MTVTFVILGLRQVAYPGMAGVCGGLRLLDKCELPRPDEGVFYDEIGLVAFGACLKIARFEISASNN